MCEDNSKPVPMSEKIVNHFLDSRTIFFFSSVDDKSANEIIQKLLYLDSLNHDDITIYVNSPGGVIDSGLGGIIDVMNLIQSDIVTVVAGHAASMGALIQCCGTKGKRKATKHSRIMIHQPLISGHLPGTASELVKEADEIDKMKEEINQIIARQTGKSIEQVRKDTERDHWLSAQEALEYGMIDEILE